MNRLAQICGAVGGFLDRQWAPWRNAARMTPRKWSGAVEIVPRPDDGGPKTLLPHRRHASARTGPQAFLQKTEAPGGLDIVVLDGEGLFARIPMPRRKQLHWMEELVKALGESERAGESAREKT